MALPFSLESLFHISHNEIPIRKYRVIQTGLNIHAGGLRTGLTIPAYQPVIDGVVNTAPMMPASSETAMAIMSLNVLLIFIKLFFLYNKQGLSLLNCSCLSIGHKSIYLK